MSEKHNNWLGAYDHYVHPELPANRNQFMWKNRNDPKSQNALKEFLEDTNDLIELVQSDF
jgi:adenine-specific DNA methylase